MRERAGLTGAPVNLGFLPWACIRTPCAPSCRATFKGIGVRRELRGPTTPQANSCGQAGPLCCQVLAPLPVAQGAPRGQRSGLPWHTGPQTQLIINTSLPCVYQRASAHLDSLEPTATVSGRQGNSCQCPHPADGENGGPHTCISILCPVQGLALSAGSTLRTRALWSNSHCPS